jgi:hypothetical protein
MNWYRCITAILLALLLAAWAWPGRASAQDGPTAEEETLSPAELKQKEMRDKQMKGLAVCVVAVFIITGVSWALNAYNKARKREALLERQQARQQADLQQQVLQQCDLPTLPVQSEPPSSYW